MTSTRRFLIAWGLILAIASTGVVLVKPETGLAATRAYCDGYARDYADRYSNPGGNMLGGAMGGAALGALFGAIAGAPGSGAAIGAGVGALGGTANAANGWNYLYGRAYNRCMAGHK